MIVQLIAGCVCGLILGLLLFSPASSFGYESYCHFDINGEYKSYEFGNLNECQRLCEDFGGQSYVQGIGNSGSVGCVFG
jgi:hypothetical protein